MEESVFLVMLDVGSEIVRYSVLKQDMNKEIRKVKL